MTEELQQQIVDSIKQIREKNWLRGKSGETMRVAINRLIECYATLKLPIYNAYDLWLE